MEIQGSNGSKTRLKPDSTTVFGRDNLSNSKDLAVSRRHLLIDLISTPNSPTSQTSPRVSFEVVGKNPIWVFNKYEGKKVKTFKRFQRGELGIGDFFCVSGKNPVWYTVNKVEEGFLGGKEGVKVENLGRFDDELSQSLEGNSGFVDDGDFGLENVDVSSIDPVQEFGFLVIGHEFDQYPKKMIPEIKNWDWFLEHRKGDSDESDDEESGEKKGKKGGRRKRKKTSGEDDVDEEWSAEGEGDELTTKATKVQRPKYHTRSIDPGISHNKRPNTKVSPSPTSKKQEKDDDDDEDEDEEDQTLGGFIVDDETADEEEEDAQNTTDDDEEEEFIEDEDEMEE